MRGQTYDFDGVSVFAMGGGESPDIDIRSDLNSWSGDERPTAAELTECAARSKKEINDLTNKYTQRSKAFTGNQQIVSHKKH